MLLSVVVPCYNEEDVLAELHRRLSDVCRAVGWEYEIVLVNDGSKDGTWGIMQGLAAGDEHLVLVNLSRNHGHQLALSAGLSIARGDRVFILDADLQDPPELLPEFMKLMDDGADVVYGQRRSRPGDSMPKRIACAVFYRMLDKLTDTPIPLDTGDFRLMSRRALDIILTMPERHRFIRGMVSWIGFDQTPLLYDRDARYAGETKYPLRKLFGLAIDGVTAFSVKPLALARIAGVVTGIFGIGILGYSLISWLSGSPPQGWTSLTAVVAIFSSVQLFVLGIIGEYLGRLYEQSKGRPLFIIRDIVKGGGREPASSKHATPEREPVDATRD